MSTSRPNLLFLITDQQRADTVDPSSPCQTPHLDRLAIGGARFTRCYATNSICSPSRASLMTGLLPHSHGMVDVTHAVEPYRARLQPGLAFWPQALQRAGYRTAYFGKWHVERSNRLERFGFDVYEVARYHQLQGLVERDEPMALRCDVRQKGYRDFLLYGVVDEPVESLPEYQLYEDGMRFLRETVAGSAATDRQATDSGRCTPDRPRSAWALFLSTEAPHDPYVAPRAYYERYDPARNGAIPQPASFKDTLADRPTIYRRIQRVWQDLGWEQFAQATACYYALCSMIDDQVGRLLALLEELGQASNTLIVFTSDHGDYMGAHRLLLKGIPAFEEAYRVPLILHGPGVPTGLVVPEVVSLLDLPRTVLDLTTGQDFRCQGRSLLPLLQEGRTLLDSLQPGSGKVPAAGWRNEAYAEMQGQRFAYQQRILWQDNYKYVFNTFDEDELYDLAADPHELRNLAPEPAWRPQLEAMAARMWQIIHETGDRNMAQAQYGMFRFAPVGPESQARPERGS